MVGRLAMVNDVSTANAIGAVPWAARIAALANMVWRVLASGWGFFSFSLGGLLLTLLVFPLIKLCWRDPAARRDRIQSVIHASFRFFVTQTVFTGVMTVEVRNAERLQNLQGALVLATHPTLLDVVVLISLMNRADCIVKESLWRHRYFGGVVRAAQYIPNCNAEQLLHDCSATLARQRPLIVFPEGTRSEPDQPFRFQRGAARVALATGCDIVPVVLTCTPATLTKGKRWYEVPSQRFHIRMVVLEPFKAADIVNPEGDPSTTSRQLTRWLQQFFSEAVAEAGGQPAT